MKMSKVTAIAWVRANFQQRIETYIHEDEASRGDMEEVSKEYKLLLREEEHSSRSWGVTCSSTNSLL
jgi:hypothetical protein